MRKSARYPGGRRYFPGFSRHTRKIPGILPISDLADFAFCILGPKLGLYTFFSPSTIYILFPYSFRILVPNRVYILEYGYNMPRIQLQIGPIFSNILYIPAGKSLKIASKKNIESEE